MKQVIFKFASMQQNQRTLLSVEGNIGSGKSTLIRLIKDRHPKVIVNLSVQIHYLDEPLTEWQSLNGDPRLNLLKEFYTNPTRWAFTMQSYAFFSRLKHWKTALERVGPDAVILSERSIQADREIFAVNGHHTQLINDLEFAIYNNYYDWLVKEVFGTQVQRQCFIYLRVDPVVAFARLQKRARAEEKDTIPVSYIEELHARHEEWLLSHKDAVVLDGNIEFETDATRQAVLLKAIESLL